ncbi:signal transduction histidine kinase [Janthinobacterium sp. CG_23.3]|uniref:sensor histidine kinase n=1 Tax=Janthinobacterium sp. CG_23.3 TaxID=3349634 RepID=UPI0038D393BE
MALSTVALLTTLELVPAGFTRLAPSKRDLLSRPVVLLVDDLAAVRALLPDYAQRLQGVVMTVGAPAQLEQLSASLWHITVEPASVDFVGVLAPGWLAAIAGADDARQKLFAAESRSERTARQLQVTRRDYNDLTTRLLAQVRDLTATENELSKLNQYLESRVLERTTDLAQANSNLSRALDDLKVTQKELVRTAQLAGLGSLVAGIAHELNTPIGNALTVATSLAHEARQLKTRHAGGQLRRSMLDQYLLDAEHIGEILERNLLRAADIIGHFKQIAIDGVSEQRRRFNLSELVADTMSVLAPQLRNSPYRLALEVAPSIDMESYPRAISQVLTNFINNALMHGFEGRAEGLMTLRAAGDDVDGVTLSFSDDGNGIDPDKVGHIFEPFFTTKFGRGGSGLGLYISYNQVHQLLGGKVDVSTAPGRGTCFTLTLPRVAPARNGPAPGGDREADPD